MLMARLTANLVLTEHLAARAWLKARIKGWRLSGSSQIADLSGSYRVDVPFLTSHMRHLNASALFLNVHTLQSQQPSSEGFDCLFGLEVKTKSDTAHWSKDHAEQEWKDTNLQLKFNHYCPYVSSQIVVIKQQTAAMNSSVQELHPLTDDYRNNALLRISATFLPCGTLLVSHLQKYQINAVENARCYGWKQAFIRRSAVVSRNSGRWRLVMWYGPIHSPLR